MERQSTTSLHFALLSKDALRVQSCQLACPKSSMGWPPFFLRTSNWSLAHCRPPCSHKSSSRKWRVDPARLHTQLAHTPPLATWSSQRSLARACQQYRPPSCKFQDSNAFKELCRIRHHTQDERAALSRHILAVRSPFSISAVPAASSEHRNHTHA